MEPDDLTDAPSEEQRAAFAISKADRDSTLAAIRALEIAIGRAAPGTESTWLERVAAQLRSLEEAVESERAESLRPESLLSMIARDYPRRFGSRVRQLREQHDDLTRTIASLRSQLNAQHGEAIDVADLRGRLGWLVAAINHRRARETDLVYEAIRLDLGRGPQDPAPGDTA